MFVCVCVCAPVLLCDTWEETLWLSCEEECVAADPHSCRPEARKEGSERPALHLCLRRGAVYSELWLLEF